MGRLKEKLRSFMTGRYGTDELNRFLGIAGLVLCVLMLIFSNSTVGRVLWFLVLAEIAYTLFRSMSRNFSARSEENRKFLQLKGKITGKINLLKRRFKDRKEYRYYSCPQCGKVVRVPRGKGKIRITCPQCANSFIKTT